MNDPIAISANTRAAACRKAGLPLPPVTGALCGTGVAPMVGLRLGRLVLVGTIVFVGIGVDCRTGISVGATVVVGAIVEVAVGAMVAA